MCARNAARRERLAYFLVALSILAIGVAGTFFRRATELSAPADWRARVQAELAAREYHAVRQGGALVAPNRACGLLTRFTPEGIEVRPRGAATNSEAAWSWRTVAFGRSDASIATSAREPIARGERVSYAHDGMLEWYENRPEGLEQGFTLAHRPAGHGPLRIEGIAARRGGAVHASGPGRMSWRADGGAEFVSEGLRALDANGRELPARFETAGERLAIVVDDAGAAYPLTVDPLLGFASSTYLGDQYSGRMGYSVRAAGDVNNDGYSDVLISAALYDVGALAAAGKTWLYMGGAGGLSPTAAWSVEGDEAAQWCGYDVAPAGDVNGDGFADFIVGFSRATYQGTVRAGMVKVYFGSAAGVSPIVETIPGGVAFAELGRKVSYLGDIDGDGYDDCLIGRMDEMYVYRGGADGVQGVPAFVKALPYPANDEGIRFSGGDVNGDGYADIAAVTSSVGDSVYVFLGGPGLSATPNWRIPLPGGMAQTIDVVGDLNGSGYADLVIGEPLASPGALAQAGRVSVFRGGASMPVGVYYTLNGTQAGAGLGSEVAAAGDLDGDGLADFTAAEPYYDLASGAHGRVLVIHGSATNIASSLHEVLDAPLHAVTFGSDVGSAGDVNGDGYGDLVVGDDQYTDGVFRTGAAWVYLGTASRLMAAASFHREGNQAGAAYGSAIAGGFDVDHDGFCDALVGAPYYDDGAFADAGKVFLYRGGPSGLSNLFSWTLTGGQSNAHLGRAVSGAGDIDADGYDDFVVGASEYDGALANEGRVLLFRGGTTLSSVAWWTHDGGLANAAYGSSLAGPGDANGDGYDDLAIGAPLWSNGQSIEGKFDFFLGGPNGPGAAPQFSAEGGQASAQLGSCVASAGDVNRDGRADLAVGATGRTITQSLEGAVTIYRGGSTGLSAAASQLLAGGQAGMNFGRSITASDMNGDGYSDVIVGAPFFDATFTSQGTARLYRGGASGVETSASYSFSPAWSAAYTGWSVAGLGDVNGDGFGDFAVGSPGYDGAAGVDAGRVFVVYGTSALPTSSLGFVADGATAGDGLGTALAGAGDTNGDGAPDLLAAAPDYSNGQSGEGHALMWYGGDEDGATRQLLLLRGNGTPLSHGGLVSAGDRFQISARRRCAAGRTRVRLQYQVAALGVSFTSAGVSSRPWSLMSGVGSDGETFAVASALNTNTGYRVHVRIQSRHPYFPRTTWATPAGASPTLAMVRTNDGSVGVEDAVTPRTLALSPPFPNPSRGRTSLAFALPGSGAVKLELFDAQGRSVRVLADGALAAGRHEFAWDGRDARGHACAAGIYFARLAAAGETRVTRVVRVP